MIVLDTNVVSELMRPVPEGLVAHWVAGQAAEDLHVTAITMAEILYGIEILPVGKRRDGLLAGAESMFGVVFVDRIVTFDH